MIELDVPSISRKVEVPRDQTLHSETCGILLSDYVKVFNQLQRANLRSSTLQQVYGHAFEFFIRVCGDKKIADYTVKDVEFFKSERCNSCSLTTVSIEFRTLHAAFNYAVKLDYLQVNPFCKSSPIRIPEKPPLYLSREEFRKLLNAEKDPDLKDFYTFAVLTGMRISEVLNLEWNAVDIERRTIHVVNHGHFLTKSGKNRTVGMNPDVHKLLHRRKTQAGICTRVFSRSGKELLRSFVEHRFKKAVRLAGLSDDLKFHSLRHSFGTWMANAGVSMFVLKELMGHSDIKTTQIYAHLTTSAIQEAVSKISVKCR